MAATRLRSSVASWRRWLPTAWCWLLTVLLLGPVLAPGFVLTYDMVWVPDLSLRADFFGFSSAVPRAVPSDAVVAVLDNVVGGDLLQAVVLVGSLVAAGTGFARMVGPSVLARTVAVSFAVWNPFVVERLWMGHWTVLVAYGTLPWIVRAGMRSRAGGRLPMVAVLVGSLSHSAGIISALALMITGLRDPRTPDGRRHDAKLIGLVLAANAPWLVAGWVHRAGAVSAPGSDVFSATGSGSLPGPLAWLPLAGIWNRAVVPDSWLGVSAWCGLALVLLLAATGARAWWSETGGSDRWRMIVLWLGGYLIAAAGLVPGVSDLLGAVPGGGAIRDGSRMLALCAPLLICLVSAGARHAWVSLPAGAVRTALGVVVVLGPLAVLPDAVWGGNGRLVSVTYPQSFAAARAVVDPDHGEALVLPFTSYRAPSWNGGRPVLDPMGRVLRAPTLTSDVLVVRGVSLPGGDPRVAAATAALAADTAEARAEALARLGMGWVVIDRSNAELVAEVPEIAGRELLRTDDLIVLRLEQEATATTISTGERVELVTAWLLWGTVLCSSMVPGLAALARMGSRSRRIVDSSH